MISSSLSYYISNSYTAFLLLLLLLQLSIVSSVPSGRSYVTLPLELESDSCLLLVFVGQMNHSSSHAVYPAAFIFEVYMRIQEREELALLKRRLGKVRGVHCIGAQIELGGAVPARLHACCIEHVAGTVHELV